MKHLANALLIAGAVLLVGCQAAPTPAAQPDASYAFGLSVGANLAKSHMDFDWDSFLRGVKEGASGQPVSLSAEEIQKIVSEALTEAKGRRALANQTAQTAFLEANARKTGVVVAAQGLQYEVLTQGSGTSPRDTDVVTLKYRTTLADGTEFENRTDKAIDVPVAKLLPGVAQGVKLMAPGARYRFYLPSSLAYGAKGRGESIEPNVPLVYEVELLGVTPAK